MFEKEIYIKRRNSLKKKIKEGIILFLGNGESPMNYTDNTYRFRQDSTFLYYFGIDEPNFAGVIDIDENKEILFGNDFDIDDIVWMGPQKSVKQKARLSGIENSAQLSNLQPYLIDNIKKGRKIHFIPQYRHENMLKLQILLGIDALRINEYASQVLIHAVADQRAVKSKEEVEQIEKALEISYEMHTSAIKMAKPGVIEKEIAGYVEGLAYSMGRGLSFPVILSKHGETLHNHSHNNVLRKGDLVVHDSGAESMEHYASDITRTFPVGGKFSERQKEIYNIVLSAQLEAIKFIKPGRSYRQVHLKAASVIAEGLKSTGLMKGDVKEAVRNGAHALFFPHGLGHLLGLDVHDLENFGEGNFGYDDKIKRSSQFGLKSLRYAKALAPGIVITVEPGIYFIPQLIDKWKAEKKFREFINYDKVDKYKDFGGVRIEDDVLVTKNGSRVLGKKIPKTIEELEALSSA
ncbi:MAG: aminopeptidase P family protein [Melioribacter sp.]|uniref:aminopeptidase P family protein n=1 Tax=Melioribacter sp. TaxID=2052167 RepID=UPI003BE393B9